MVTRFEENPIVRPALLKPSGEGMKIECTINPGAFRFEGKTWLIVRVCERPPQTPGKTTFPIFDEQGKLKILTFDNADPDLDLSDARLVTYKGVTYLSTISHLRLICSDDGVRFYEPEAQPRIITGLGALETFGIEDCRVAKIGDTFYLTYTEVSESGVGVGMISTRDWRAFVRHGMIIPPHNKDCALFEEKIGGKYWCLHRPSGTELGGNFIWLASSPDLLHWGSHRCIAHTRPGKWDAARVGAGCSPIKTDKGWLMIYHGATKAHRYCLGAILLDLNDPAKVLARSDEPLMEPTLKYETCGFFGEVIFTNGHVVEGDAVTMYYGAADEVICGATLSVQSILCSLGV